MKNEAPNRTQCRHIWSETDILFSCEEGPQVEPPGSFQQQWRRAEGRVWLWQVSEAPFPAWVESKAEGLRLRLAWVGWQREVELSVGMAMGDAPHFKTDSTQDQ